MTSAPQPYRRRIGLLGGSFNPAHAGHREISIAALERLELDAVWWLVTPGNPFKDATDYAPYDLRLKQARRVADHPDIVISDFEYRHALQYTVDTLERLILLNPNADLVWVMGADSFADFHRWRDWRKISLLAPFAIFNRPGYEDAALKSEAATTLADFRVDLAQAHTLLTTEPPAWVFFTDTDNPLSSTELRAANNRKEPPNP